MSFRFCISLFFILYSLFCILYADKRSNNLLKLMRKETIIIVNFLKVVDIDEKGRYETKTELMEWGKAYYNKLQPAKKEGKEAFCIPEFKTYKEWRDKGYLMPKSEESKKHEHA